MSDYIIKIFISNFNFMFYAASGKLPTRKIAPGQAQDLV